MDLYLWFILVGVIFLVFRVKFFSHAPSETASAAIVMAYGIFINGALYLLPFPNIIGTLLSISLIFFWISIGTSYMNAAIRHVIKSKHFKNSMQIFAVGTWIAGTSVCGIVVAKRLPELQVLAYVMGFIAVFLWVFYLVMVLKRFVYIWKTNQFNEVHGAILLSTVSTESLVVFFYTLFGNQISRMSYLFFIILGIIFYIVGFIYIMKRYLSSKTWDITVDWPNTNCIIHGAMSITGLASSVSGAVHSHYILFIWLWVIVWYVIVEFIEIFRAKTRVQKLGFEKGLGTYNVTQWSRNFTFGMLFAFTLSFDIKKVTAVHNDTLFVIRDFILNYGAWVVLFFIVYESVLFIKEKSYFKNPGLFTTFKSSKE